MLTIICCGVVGSNRHSAGHNVGFRTCSLVGIASLLIQMVGINIGTDPTRISGQFLTAIGFACSAVIFKQDQNVKGLTTSVSILTSVCIGISIGSGLIIETLISVILIILILKDPFRIDKSKKGNT